MPEEYYFFRKILEEDGIASTRIEDLFNAFDELHRAIAKLDISQLRTFWNRDIEERLSEFAESEGLRDVVPAKFGGEAEEYLGISDFK